MKDQMSDNQLEKIDRLIEIRKELGLNQTDMAVAIGISQSKLSAIENKREGKDILNNIHFALKSEFSINPEWFKTGNGDKYLPNGINETTNSNDARIYRDELIAQLKRTVEEKNREIDRIINYTDKIISRTEQSLRLTEEKVHSYEKKISTDVSSLDITTQPHAQSGREKR